MLPNQEFVGWIARVAGPRFDMIVFSDMQVKIAAMQEFNLRIPGGIIKNIAPLLEPTQREIMRIQDTKMDEQSKAEHVMKLLGWTNANYIILKGS